MRRTAASSTSIAAVTWWRWMALRITCGSQVLSKKPSSLPVLTFLGLSLFSQGCASNQPLPDSMAAAAQRQLETVIRDTRAEAEAKAAETSVQARMKELESSMATLTTELEQVKKTLARLQNESDTKSRTSAKAGKTTRSP